MARVEKTSLQFEITINGEKKVLQTMKEVRAQRRTIIKQLDTLVKGSEEYNQKIRELGKLNAIIDDHRGKIKQAGQSMTLAQKAGAGFNKIVGSIGASLKAAFGPVGLILAAVSAMVELGRSAFQAAEEVGKTQERINQLTGLTGEGLQDASAKAVALAKTYEIDLSQGIEAANAATNGFIQEGEELGDVYTSTLDKIGERLLGLGDKGDEFLSQISEYSARAEEAGLSMDRFFNLVVAGVNKGVPTDKIIDSVKEFDIRIKTISKGQKAELEAVLGKNFTDSLLEGVESGSIESIEALDRVSGKISELGAGSANAQKVVSAIFGGPGEDATGRYLELIGQVGESLSDVVDTSNVYIQRKQELNRLEEEAAKAAGELAFLTDGTGDSFRKVGLTIKTFFITQLSRVIEFIQYFPDYFSAATSSGKAFVNSLISSFEFFLRNSLLPIILVFEKLTGKSFKLPRFDIEDDPFKKVEDKIAADRKAFEERQRQETLLAQGKTEAAERLQALQAEKRKAGELAKERQAALEKRLKEEEDANRAIEDLRNSLIANQLERQIQQLELQAERQIEAVKGSAEQRAEQERLIEEKLAQDIAKIKDAAAKREMAAQAKRDQDAKKAREKAFKDQIDDLEASLEQRTLEITGAVVQQVETGAITALEAEKSLQDQLKEEYIKYLEEKRKLTLAAGEDETAIALEQERLKFEELLKLAEEDRERRGGLNGEELEDLARETAFNSAQELANKALEADLDRIRQRREALEDEEAKAIERAGDNEAAKQAIAERFAKQKEDLDKAQARKEKSLALKRSLIDFALALFKAIASAPPPINLGAIAAQTALLTIPQGILAAISFAKGGMLPEAGKGGLAQGPSHQDGHIYLVNGRTGQTAGAIEGGEPILSKKTYRNNKALVDALLHSSMYQDGKAIIKPMYAPDKSLFHPERPLFNEGGILPGANLLTTPSAETSSTARANPELAVLSSQLADLSAAYREGKTIIMGEREADLIGQLMDKREKDRARRA